MKKLIGVEKTTFEFSEKEFDELVYILKMMEYTTKKERTSKFTLEVNPTWKKEITEDKGGAYFLAASGNFEYTDKKGENFISNVIEIYAREIICGNYIFEVVTTNEFDGFGNMKPWPDLAPWSAVFNTALMRAMFRTGMRVNPTITPATARQEFIFQLLGKWYTIFTYMDEKKKENCDCEEDCGDDCQHKQQEIGTAVRLIGEMEAEKILQERKIPAVRVIGWNVLGQLPAFEDGTFSSIIPIQYNTPIQTGKMLVSSKDRIWELMNVKEEDNVEMWTFIESGKVCPILGIQANMNESIEASLGIIGLLLQENKTNPKFSKLNLVLV